MQRMSFLIVLCLTSVLGCGDDSAASDSDAAAADCPNVGGVFTIRTHCSQALVGTQVTVDQKACNFSTTGAYAGLSGTLAKDGSFTLAGTISGAAVSCTGTATSHSITQECTGNCSVTLDR